jgi:hypothetical protein
MEKEDTIELSAKLNSSAIKTISFYIDIVKFP